MLGAIGGGQRLDSSVVGDTANLASSAENLTRLFGALAPKDDAAALYVQRCKDLIDNPPKADWQGLSVLERK